MEEKNANERVLVDVWDWQTRVLHWTNMLLVVMLALLMLGKSGLKTIGVSHDHRDAIATIHAYVGYIFICTLTLRIIWGFIGNRYARFSDILPLKKEQRDAIGQNIRWYLGGFKGRPAKAPGHDPLASLFYIALFIILVSQAFTGLVMSGTEFKMFPGTLFAPLASGELKEAFEEMHEFGFWFVVFFLTAHLGGLVVHEIKEKTGLLSSMVHGKKYFTKEA